MFGSGLISTSSMVCPSRRESRDANRATILALWSAGDARGLAFALAALSLRRQLAFRVTVDGHVTAEIVRGWPTARFERDMPQRATRPSAVTRGTRSTVPRDLKPDQV